MSLHAPALSRFAAEHTLAGMAQWHAVYTYPRHEQSVARYLENRSVEVFVPTFEVVSRWKDRTVRLETPLFPGYVFTRIAPEERNKVVSAPSVIRMLSFNGKPCPIAESEVEAIRVCIAGGAALQPHMFLQVGERVRIRSGAFEGVEGIVLRHKGACQLVISVALIQQSVALEISAYQLEPLRDHVSRISSPAPAVHSK
jgi:transcription antitermination factor NusG